MMTSRAPLTPITHMAKQAGDTGVHWYAIQTYSGYEHSVAKAIRQRIETMNMHDFIFDTMVPEETEIVIKKGEKKEEKKKLFPGYVLVKMKVTDESWYVVRNTPNVTGFVGSGVIPVPLTDEELMSITGRMQVDDKKFKEIFEKGQVITITEGPFMGHDGVVTVVDTDKGRVTASVSLFGRDTKVDLTFDQARRKV